MNVSSTKMSSRKTHFFTKRCVVTNCVRQKRPHKYELQCMLGIQKKPQIYTHQYTITFTYTNCFSIETYVFSQTKKITHFMQTKCQLEIAYTNIFTFFCLILKNWCFYRSSCVEKKNRSVKLYVHTYTFIHICCL